MASWRRSPLPSGWDTRIRPRILERDDWACQLRYPGCEHVATDVDHIHGHDNHSGDNLQAACGRCHRTKTAREANAAKPKRLRRVARHPGLT